MESLGFGVCLLLASRFLCAGAHNLSSADDELELVPGTQQESEIAGK